MKKPDRSNYTDDELELVAMLEECSKDELAEMKVFMQLVMNEDPRITVTHQRAKAGEIPELEAVQISRQVCRGIMNGELPLHLE